MSDTVSVGVQIAAWHALLPLSRAPRARWNRSCSTWRALRRATSSAGLGPRGLRGRSRRARRPYRCSPSPEGRGRARPPRERPARVEGAMTCAACARRRRKAPHLEKELLLITYVCLSPTSRRSVHGSWPTTPSTRTLLARPAGCRSEQQRQDWALRRFMHAAQCRLLPPGELSLAARWDAQALATLWP